MFVLIHSLIIILNESVRKCNFKLTDDCLVAAIYRRKKYLAEIKIQKKEHNRTVMSDINAN